jgi:nucleotide-binding universal stress UspA family protein
VFDALPLLAAAKDVTITVVPEKQGDRAEILAQVADVAAWLRGHGIVASTVVPEKTGDAIAQLDKVAADIEAGAVIAGAYGHSRLREWILGGVTRHLATGSRRCAILSR